MIDNLKERFNVTTGQVYATLYSAHIGIEKLKDRLHELSSFSGTLTIGFTELRISSLLLQYFLFDLPQRSAYAKGKALGVIQTREHISRLKSPALLYVKREIRPNDAISRVKIPAFNLYFTCFLGAKGIRPDKCPGI